MKKLIFAAIILASIGATAQKITPVTIGINKVADSLSVSVLTFKTTDKTCQLYYSIFDGKKLKIDEGNLQLTEKEFSSWGETNKYIEDLALSKLKLTRKETVSKLTGNIDMTLNPLFKEILSSGQIYNIKYNNINQYVNK